MRRKSVIAIVILVITILVTVQIVIDYISNKSFKDEAVQVAKNNDCLIFIEIEDKTLYLLKDGKCIREYAIASGMSGWPSPLGEWKVIERDDWGEGFGGRWLGLDVPWGTYGIHGTLFQESVGSAASHGCIRMFNRDIKELYNMVSVGTPVVIVNGTFGPFGNGFDDINPGDRGSDVWAVQKKLKQLGYFKGEFTGIYEDDLKHALHRFQKEKGLEAKNTITIEDYLAMGFREFE